MLRKRRSNENETANKKRAKVTVTLISQVVDTSYRSGKILRVKLQNFMCHSNLAVDLHPNINFLVGRNGSGKSAILAALVLGLGCKASVTSRSTNFKQFIKSGENFSVIDIEIENRGPGTFEHEVYGDKIIVSRRITVTGSSTYKLKSASGHTISSRSDDLRKMLVYLNIQADNPVFVLNQDNARSFLKDLDHKKNYELFVKATQIEGIQNKLTESDILFENQRMNYNYSLEQKKVLLSEIDELQQMYIRLETAENNKKLLKECTNEKNWGLVIEKETASKELSDSILKMKTERETKTKQITDKDSIEKNIKEKMRQLEKEILDTNSSVRNENIIENNLREMLTTKNESCLGVEQELLKVRERSQRYRNEINDFKNHVRDRELASAITSTQNLREENEKRINMSKVDLAEANARIENTKLEIQMLSKTKERVDEENLNSKMQYDRLVGEVKTYSTQLKEIKKASQDNLAIYGPNVSAFVASLENAYKAGQLSKMPLGPIGRYITIPNEKYRCIIETILGSVLSSFIVNNTSDRNVIDAMLKKNFKQYSPSIITVRFPKEAYNVSQGKVTTSPGTHLLMDEISCSSYIVTNTLIDRCSIEKILLTEDQSVAVHLTENVENVPENLNKIFLVNPGVEFHPATTSYRMYSLNLREPRFIQVNMAQRLTQIKNSLTEKINLAEVKGKLLKDYEKEINEINAKINEKKTVFDRHDQRKREIQEKIEELESIEYPGNNEFDILSRELAELETKFSKCASKIQTMEAQVEKTKVERIDAENQLKIQKKKMKELQEIIHQNQKKYDEHNRSLKSLTNVMKSHENEVKELETQIQSYQNQESVLGKELNNAKLIAVKTGNRVETNKSLEELHTFIQKLEKEIKQNSKNTGNKKDVQILIEEKKLNYKIVEELGVSIKTMLKTLLQCTNRRYNILLNLKKNMSIRVQYIFENILKIRGFAGQINMNHNLKTLDVIVVPRNQLTDDVVKNTKSLSGGERSFTTVAFLLSLWSCIDHPFYFLDEYDVFTDKVNQSIMTSLLIDEAKKNTNRQYTFLTPQNTSITSSEYIQIHRLSDPKP